MFGAVEQFPDQVDGVGWDDRPISGCNGNIGSRSAKGFRQMLAGFLGSDEEKAGGRTVGLEGVREERIGHGLGYGLGGDKGWGEADGHEGFGSGGADRGDFRAERHGRKCGMWAGWQVLRLRLANVRAFAQDDRFEVVRAVLHREFEVSEAAVEGFDGIGAGEEQPVKALEMAERAVERGKRGGFGKFDGGNKDGLGAEGAQVVGERRGLVGRAGDEDAGWSQEISQRPNGIN